MHKADIQGGLGDEGKLYIVYTCRIYFAAIVYTNKR